MELNGLQFVKFDFGTGGPEMEIASSGEILSIITV